MHATYCLDFHAQHSLASDSTWVFWSIRKLTTAPAADFSNVLDFNRAESLWVPGQHLTVKRELDRAMRSFHRRAFPQDPF